MLIGSPPRTCKKAFEAGFLSPSQRLSYVIARDGNSPSEAPAKAVWVNNGTNTNLHDSILSEVDGTPRRGESSNTTERGRSKARSANNSLSCATPRGKASLPHRYSASHASKGVHQAANSCGEHIRKHMDTASQPAHQTRLRVLCTLLGVRVVPAMSLPLLPFGRDGRTNV